MAKNAQSKGVLSDHKKVGSRLIPPMLELGPITDISWVSHSMPELLWLALLIYTFGLQRGAELAVSLAKAAVKAVPSPRKRWYGPTSAYGILTDEAEIAIRTILLQKGTLRPLQKGLATLVALYPECPLAFLYADELPTLDECELDLNEFKEFVDGLYNKYEPLGTFAHANAFYIAAVTDMVRIAEGVSLANFPAIADFPRTEESKQVAAGLYAMLSGFMSMALEEYGTKSDTPWTKYFWNRGLELEPCTIGGVVKYYGR